MTEPNQQIRIPAYCVFCDPLDHAELPASVPNPASGLGETERLLTRIEWKGADAGTCLVVIVMEGQAGWSPSQVEHPGVNWSVTACWCPGCRVQYRIGPDHPTFVAGAPKAGVIKRLN